MDTIDQHEYDMLYIELLKIINDNNISYVEYKHLDLFKNTSLFDKLMVCFYPTEHDYDSLHFRYSNREKLKKEIICKIFRIKNIENVDEVYHKLITTDLSVTKFISYYIDKKFTMYIKK